MVYTWQALSHDGECNPATNFVCIVRARYQVEHQRKWILSWARDFAFLRTCRAQIAQQIVNAKVSQFANLNKKWTILVEQIKNINRILFYRPESKCNIGLHFTRSRVEWMIDVVSNVGSKEPVIAAIAEQVANGHGSVRETMNENSF